MGAAQTIVAKTSDGQRKRNKPQIDAVVDGIALPRPTGAESILTKPASTTFNMISAKAQGSAPLSNVDKK